MGLDVSGIADTQAEAGVIATLMYHPEFILHTDYLKPRHFYDETNGCFYWAVSELYKSGVDNIDAFNISNMLNSHKGVKRKIEEQNIINIQDFIDMAQFAARHTLEEYKLLVDNVVTLSFKRDLNRVTYKIQAGCFNPEMDLGKLNTLVNSEINGLTEQYLHSEDVALFGSKVDEMWEEILSRRSENGIYGLPSKFPSLNEYFSYEIAELVLVRARMKRGKSALLMNEAIHKIKAGVPTLYIDTEMSDRLFFERMLANLTSIDVKRIKKGTYSYEEEQRLAKANEWLKTQPFVHMYMPTISEEELYSIHKILKYKMNLQFSIYDYIKGDMVDSSALYNFLGQRTNFLKNNIAGDLEIPVLAAAQLNRNNQVADSDKIERYASVSILWREKEAEEIARDGLDGGNYCMNISLNRLGEQMSEDEIINFNFNGNVMQITEAEPPKKEETPFAQSGE